MPKAKGVRLTLSSHFLFSLFRLRLSAVIGPFRFYRVGKERLDPSDQVGMPLKERYYLLIEYFDRHVSFFLMELAEQRDERFVHLWLVLEPLLFVGRISVSGK